MIIMKKVILKTMEIEHFKGVKSQKIDFSDYTEIIGDNGTGKSTINEAYMWCIFSKNTFGNVVSITPRDENNRIIPKVESVVKLTLEVDGIEHTLCRKQKQNWRTNKEGIEIFNGYTQERYFDEIPRSVSEYNLKVSEICLMDNWFMLSSIYAFMGMKQDDRRKMLIQLAGDIKEEELLQKYPALIEATHNLKISIADLQKQKKIAYTKIEKDLLDIPTRIDELSKQIVEYDFVEIVNEITKLEDVIKDIHKDIEKVQSQGCHEMIQELKDKVKSYDKDLNDISDSLMRERNKKEDEIDREIRKVTLNIDLAKKKKSTAEDNLANIKYSISARENELAKKKEEWIKENEKEFDVESNSVCPTCKQSLNISSIQVLQEEYYMRKDNILTKITQDAQRIKETKATLVAEMLSLDDEINNQQQVIEENEIVLKELNAKLQSIPPTTLALASHKEYNKLVEVKEELLSQIRKLEMSSDNEETLKKLQELQDKRETSTKGLKELQEKLYQKSVNENIKNRIETLEKESYQLAQDKVDCKYILSEIDKFKKARIEVVEEKVSGLFEIVKWKMYEPNVSNDGEKEICQALINGKAYEEQNTATKVNASVDIINGLSKALQMQLPLFIDNKESVTNKISSNSQIIALSVVKGAKLIIN